MHNDLDLALALALALPLLTLSRFTLGALAGASSILELYNCTLTRSRSFSEGAAMLIESGAKVISENLLVSANDAPKDTGERAVLALPLAPCLMEPYA